MKWRAGSLTLTYPLATRDRPPLQLTGTTMPRETPPRLGINPVQRGVRRKRASPVFSGWRDCGTHPISVDGTLWCR